MKSIRLCCMALSVLALLASSASLHAAEKEVSLHAVSSPVGSVAYVGLGLLGKAATTLYPEIDFNLLPGGAHSNPARIAKGDAQIGFTMRSMAVALGKGLPPFKQALSGVATMANVQDYGAINIVIRKDLDIKSLDELREKKPALRFLYGGVGGAGQIYSRWIFEEYGFSQADMKKWGGAFFTNSFSDMVNLMKDGQLDMFIWIGAGEPWFMGEVATNVPVRWLPIEGERAGRIAEKYGFGLGVLPASGYGGRIGEDVPTLVEVSNIIVDEKLPDDVVYKLTRALCENAAAIRDGQPSWAGFKPETAWKDVGFPLHPGAARYYREQGYMQ